MKQFFIFVTLVNFIFFPSLAIADRPDHPLLGRYNDAKTAIWHELPYERFPFVTNGGINKETVVEMLEGKITHHTYNTRQDDTVLRVTKNYEKALRKAGFEIVFQCEKATCGGNIPKNILAKQPILFPKFYAGYAGGSLGGFNYLENATWNYSFITAKKQEAGTDFYVTLVIVKNASLNFVAISQDMVELTEMDTDLVAEPVGLIKLDDLEKGIKTAGHIALEGIYFETNKDVITPNSAETLAVIGEYLNKYPEQKFYVVGHTDMVRAYDFNMNLSQKRADSVTVYLANKHGIAAERLHGVGVGEAAPVAENQTEGGRAKNRRVELVLSVE